MRRASNHARRSRNRTTSPMTASIGGASRAARARVTTAPSVLTVTSCASVVPQRISATGVSGERPWPTSSAAMRGRLCAPMSTTSVSTAVARRPQSTSA